MQKLAVRRRILPLLIPCGVLILVFLLVQFLIRAGSPDRKFQAETEKFFAEEITSTTINLHYTLADPAAAGIEDYPITLGAETSEEDDPSLALLEHLVPVLPGRGPERRKPTDLSASGGRPGKPRGSCGIPSAAGGPQSFPGRPGPAAGPALRVRLPHEAGHPGLPGTFKRNPRCFRQILEFEEQKARGGYFMNDAAAEGVIAQCRAFLEDPPLLLSAGVQFPAKAVGIFRPHTGGAQLLPWPCTPDCWKPAYIPPTDP